VDGPLITICALSRIAGTVLAQILLVPSAVLIVWVAGWM
jgi:hypothetical protein